MLIRINILFKQVYCPVLNKNRDKIVEWFGAKEEYLATVKNQSVKRLCKATGNALMLFQRN